MAKVYLGLGTNLGDKEQNLRDAVQKIEEQVGKIVSLSAFYVTAPWGFASECSGLCRYRIGSHRRVTENAGD